MKVILALCCLLCATAVTHAATFYSCGWITSSLVNCNLFTQKDVCGTDRQTYRNKCEFSRKHCVDPTVDLLHDGPCTDLDRVTTRDPIQGAEVILDFFCQNLSHKACDPNDVSKVCATDGRTYQNFCEYEKERCTHRNLHVASFGDCSS